MSEESYGFEKARVRLEEIVTQVRKKDVSLEKSLDLLEEGVRLANQCVEQIDHADWDAAAGGIEEDDDSDAEDAEESAADDTAQDAPDDGGDATEEESA